jgi:hypothetical protein
LYHDRIRIRFVLDCESSTSKLLVIRTSFLYINCSRRNESSLGRSQLRVVDNFPNRKSSDRAVNPSHSPPLTGTTHRSKSFDSIRFDPSSPHESGLLGHRFLCPSHLPSSRSPALTIAGAICLKNDASSPLPPLTGTRLSSYDFACLAVFPILP